VTRRTASGFSGLTTALPGPGTTRTVAPPRPRLDAGEGWSWRSAGKAPLVLFGLVLACYLSAPNVTDTDAYLAMPTAVSVVHSHNLDLDEFHSALIKDHYGYIELQGRHFDRYPWADSLLLVPGVLVVDLLHAVHIGSGATAMVESNHMGPVQLVSASLVTALAVVAVFALAWEGLAGPASRRRRTSFAVALVFALGTAAWSTASRAMWQHGPSMLALAVALLVASRLERGDQPRRRPARTAAALGVALATAYVLRPTNVIALVGFSVLVVIRHRRLLGSYLAGLFGVLAVFATVNLVSYGRLLPPYYAASRIRIHPAYLEALAANLVSPARGLLVFSPVVGFAVAGLVVRARARKVRPLDVVVAGCAVAQLLIVSAQDEGWWAGHAFGPRFMSDVLPLLAYLSLPAVDALAAALRTPRPTLGAKVAAAGAGLAVLSSVAVNAEGAYLRSATCWNAEPVNIDQRPSRVWDLHDPQVLAGYRSIRAEGLRTAMLGHCHGDPTEASSG
jgi:hypothetical protein